MKIAPNFKWYGKRIREGSKNRSQLIEAPEINEIKAKVIIGNTIVQSGSHTIEKGTPFS